MNLSVQKRIAAEILKCGVSRVRIKQDKAVEEAITREDVRGLIAKGLIKKIQKKGTSRSRSRKILYQKSRGRRRGPGSKQGESHPGKREWMALLRAQRRLLMELRSSEQLSGKDYRMLYGRAKGGMFRNKGHLFSYIKERDLLKGGKR